ncbi:Protein of unknown function [Gryllus bimaculatus]|nr:Protein of unknown function [Gryllus bimaculatus]
MAENREKSNRALAFLRREELRLATCPGVAAILFSPAVTWIRASEARKLAVGSKLAVQYGGDNAYEGGLNANPPPPRF